MNDLYAGPRKIWIRSGNIPTLCNGLCKEQVSLLYGDYPMIEAREAKQNRLNLQFNSTAVCGKDYAAEKPCCLFQNPRPFFPLIILRNETKPDSSH